MLHRKSKLEHQEYKYSECEDMCQILERRIGNKNIGAQLALFLFILKRQTINRTSLSTSDSAPFTAKPCPNPSCPGRLELLACRGHCGYPVTHFWRHLNGAVYFQAKGYHDHPRPDVKSLSEKGRSTFSKQIKHEGVSIHFLVLKEEKQQKAKSNNYRMTTSLTFSPPPNLFGIALHRSIFSKSLY